MYLKHVYMSNNKKYVFNINSIFLKNNMSLSKTISYKVILRKDTESLSLRHLICVIFQFCVALSNENQNMTLNGNFILLDRLQNGMEKQKKNTRNTVWNNFWKELGMTFLIKKYECKIWVNDTVARTMDRFLLRGLVQARIFFYWSFAAFYIILQI